MKTESMQGGVRALLILALGAEPWAPAAAQEDFRFFEEEALVYAAAKHPQRVSRAPAVVDIITAEDIRRLGYRTIAQALQSVPGFYYTDDHNYVYLWVRGFGRPADYNSRVLLLLNGHRLNENPFGGAYVGHEFPVDIRSVDRIEVVKGPGSALFGNNAFFAVVNVITRSAPAQASASVAAETGSEGTRAVFVEAGGAPDGARLYAAGSYRNREGRDMYFPEYAATARGMDGERDYNSFGSVDLGAWRVQGAAGSRTKAVPTGSFGTVFGDPRFKTFDTRSFVEASRAFELSDNALLNVRGYYDWYYYGGDYPYANTAPPPVTVLNRDITRSEWYGSELRLSLTPWGDSDALILGHEIEQDRRCVMANVQVDPASTLYDVDAGSSRWALFAQQELSLPGNVDLTLGARHDRFSDWGDSTNPRAAAVWRASPNGTLKVLYGTAFRAPTPYEVVYAAPGYWKGNPDLKPERIKSGETHWEQRLGGPLRLSVGGFHSVIDRLTSEEVDPADGLIHFVNSRRVWSMGLETSLRWEGRIWSLRGGYIRQRTRYDDGGRLSNSPQNSGTAALSARLPWLGATAGMDGFFIGRRQTVAGTTLGAKALLNATLSLEPAPQTRVSLSVYNLTGTDYQVSGSSEHLQESFQQSPRAFRVAVERRFGGGR